MFYVSVNGCFMTPRICRTITLLGDRHLKKFAFDRLNAPSDLQDVFVAYQTPLVHATARQ